MLYIPDATRGELENAILTEQGLYEHFDEKKFLAEEYTTEEYREIIQQWIEDGDETADCCLERAASQKGI